jgi:hypothetical protein
MNKNDPRYPEFIKEFWEWFDDLPPKKRQMFCNAKNPFAELNFYFTVWSKKNLDKPED